MMDDSDIDGPVAVCSLFLYRNSKCGHIFLNFFSTRSQHSSKSSQHILNICSNYTHLLCKPCGENIGCNPLNQRELHPTN